MWDETDPRCPGRPEYCQVGICMIKTKTKEDWYIGKDQWVDM